MVDRVKGKKRKELVSRWWAPTSYLWTFVSCNYVMFALGHVTISILWMIVFNTGREGRAQGSAMRSGGRKGLEVGVKKVSHFRIQYWVKYMGGNGWQIKDSLSQLIRVMANPSVGVRKKKWWPALVTMVTNPNMKATIKFEKPCAKSQKRFQNLWG